MIEQSANLGAFISGLYTEDYDLIGRSLKDVIIEPLRSVLIPKFEKIKSVVLILVLLAAAFRVLDHLYLLCVRELLQLKM